MKKLYVPLLILLIFLLAAPLFSAEVETKRAYPCYQLAREPVLDGKLKDDPAWKTIPAATGFFQLGTSRYASKQTMLKMAHTQEALYLGLECEEPEIEKLVAYCQDDTTDICLEDSVEIFVFPKGAGTYAQLMANAIGSRWNRIRQDEPPKLSDWQAAAYREKGGWSIEIKIPFAIFGRTPENQEAWTINVCRNSVTSAWDNRFTSWACLPDARTGFHAPDKFGVITFENTALSPEEAGKIENTLNLAYRKYTAGEIKRTTALIYGRRGGFVKKSRDTQLRQEILSLLKTGADTQQQISRLNLNTVPIEKLRLLLNQNFELLRRSDELEGRLLLENLIQAN